MVEIEVTDREYFVNWDHGDLGGRIHAFLVLRPLRTYAQQSPLDCEQMVLTAYNTVCSQRREHAVLPAGMYEYYLADRTGSTLHQITSPVKKFLGEKQSVSVKLCRASQGQDAVQLTLESPMALEPKECGVDYGLSEPFLLPGTRPKGNVHVIQCLLFRFRSELSMRMWYTPELKEFLQLEEKSLRLSR